jgi:hypothetical protein
MEGLERISIPVVVFVVKVNMKAYASEEENS